MNDIGVNPNQQVAGKELRSWPGLILVGLLLVIRYGLPQFAPKMMPLAMFGGMILAILILLWWVLLSRASGKERVLSLVIIVGVYGVTTACLHPSIATSMMGFMLPMFATPMIGIMIVVWALLTRRFQQLSFRLISLCIAMLCTCAVWTLLRTDGVTGNFTSELAWRWSTTAEEKLLASTENELRSPKQEVKVEVNTEALEWAGFRGAHRDGMVKHTQIETDWKTHPPQQLWARKIGPAWSSFAVSGQRLFTQEQRGDEELVSCYDLTSGTVLWAYRDAERFWESMAGPGPRATPAYHDGRIYSLGATGILNVLNASDGKLIWSHNVAREENVSVPTWGLSGSPLIYKDLVIVSASRNLVAYDLSSGEKRWSAGEAGEGYGSPHTLNIDSVEQILLVSTKGLMSVSPTDGALLWDYAWEGSHIVQPCLTEDGDLLIGTAYGVGLRRLHVQHKEQKWDIQEVWTSLEMNPDFNDYVLHQGYLYGYDAFNLMCLDVKDGSRKWVNDGPGGQLLLLADQSVLVILAENGELILVKAQPDAYTELARIPVLNGKTWNHPVLVGDVLLLRNGEEMKALRLALLE